MPNQPSDADKKVRAIIETAIDGLVSMGATRKDALDLLAYQCALRHAISEDRMAVLRLADSILRLNEPEAHCPPSPRPQ